MAPLRHPSRHIHQTLVDHVRTILTSTGWVDAPINYGARAVSIQEVEPRTPEKVEPNVVAVTIDFPTNPLEAELGDGLTIRSYQLFVDVLAENDSTCKAICDDLIEGLLHARILVHDYNSGLDTTWMIHLDDLDVDEPPAAGQVDRSTWRVVTGPAEVYYTEQS